jgi:hypothetical protein
MTFMDKAKGLAGHARSAATQAVDKAGPKIAGGIDKAKGMVDERTGRKHSGTLDRAAAKAKDALDGLDGRNDDIPPSTPPSTPPPASHPPRS